MKRALAAAFLVALLLPPGAGAHFGTGKKGYRSRVTAVSPALPGLQVRVLGGDDRIWLDNLSGKTIVIRGYSGEPYLRFGAGKVFVNERSPAVYLNLDRYARTKLPKFANPKAPPDWQQLAASEVWSWHDHRVHWMSPIAPKPIRDAPRTNHHLFDWKVPATAGGRRMVISGSLDYVPPPKAGFPVGFAVAIGAVLLIGSIGLLALRGLLQRALK